MPEKKISLEPPTNEVRRSGEVVGITDRIYIISDEPTVTFDEILVKGRRMSGACLMGRGSATTSTQKWFYSHSDGLENSFRGSEEIRHRVTKGESREHIILDTIEKLIPTSTSVGRNVVIRDSEDDESPKFDGVLIDRTSWPLLYKEEATAVAMIESIVAAIEIKSSLAAADLSDIFAKARGIRRMRSADRTPIMTAFAYKCPNPNLMFFDFAASFHASPNDAPNLVCMLNRGLFGVASHDTVPVFDVDDPTTGRPGFIRSGKDTLLIYVYILSRWATRGSRTVEAFKGYSEAVFSKVKMFHFDDDFLRAMTLSEGARLAARGCFMYRPRQDINDLYGTARSTLDLA